MSRINPLYTGILLLFIVIFIGVKLSNAKDDLQEAKISFNDVEMLANEISGLKGAYANKKMKKQTFLRTLSQPVLSAAKIEKKVSSSSIKISSQSIDLRALNYLLGKVLNDTYNISSLQIKRLSDTKSSLEMEIKW